MAETQRGRCSSDVPGDTQRNLSVENRFSRVTFKHVLLPIWIAAYRYGGKPYQFLVNGQTGEVVGKAPWSFWKIFFAVVALLAVIAVAIVIYQSQQPSGGGSGRGTAPPSVPTTNKPLPKKGDRKSVV